MPDVGQRPPVEDGIDLGDGDITDFVATPVADALGGDTSRGAAVRPGDRLRGCVGPHHALASSIALMVGQGAVKRHSWQYLPALLLVIV